MASVSYPQNNFDTLYEESHSADMQTKPEEVKFKSRSVASPTRYPETCSASAIEPNANLQPHNKKEDTTTIVKSWDLCSCDWSPRELDRRRVFVWRRAFGSKRILMSKILNLTQEFQA